DGDRERDPFRGVDEHARHELAHAVDEGEQGAGHDAAGEQRQHDLAERVPPARAEAARGVLQVGVELGERGEGRPEDQRVEAHEVRQGQDREGPHQHLAERERRRARERRDEVDRHDRAGEGPGEHDRDVERELAAEAHPAHDIGRPGAEDHRTADGDHAHQQRVGHGPPELEAAEQPPPPFQGVLAGQHGAQPPALGGEGQHRDHDDREHEEDGDRHRDHEQHDLGRRARDGRALAPAALRLRAVDLALLVRADDRQEDDRDDGERGRDDRGQAHVAVGLGDHDLLRHHVGVLEQQRRRVRRHRRHERDEGAGHEGRGEHREDDPHPDPRPPGAHRGRGLLERGVGVGQR
ncbi:hypothetical protein ABE10_01670, partial [Bacillus toyonensis]|nr:hypothetical protein [Bacillus toyonensis]